MNIEIRKGKGIEGLVSGNEIDVDASVTVELNPKIEAAIMMIEDAAYQKLTDKHPTGGLNWENIMRSEYVRRNAKHKLALTPAEICAAVTIAAPKWTEHQSLVVNRLIQVSYDAGHNDFRLDVGSKGFSLSDMIGYNGPLSIDINCEDLESCGSGMDRCIINANCEYIASIQHCTGIEITIHGDFGDLWGKMENSTFKTHNRATFEKLKEFMQYDNNKLILINPDGTEEVTEYK